MVLNFNVIGIGAFLFTSVLWAQSPDDSSTTVSQSTPQNLINADGALPSVGAPAGQTSQGIAEIVEDENVGRLTTTIAFDGWASTASLVQGEAGDLKSLNFLDLSTKTKGGLKYGLRQYMAYNFASAAGESEVKLDDAAAHITGDVANISPAGATSVMLRYYIPVGEDSREANSWGYLRSDIYTPLYQRGRYNFTYLMSPRFELPKTREDESKSSFTNFKLLHYAAGAVTLSDSWGASLGGGFYHHFEDSFGSINRSANMVYSVATVDWTINEKASVTVYAEQLSTRTSSDPETQQAVRAFAPFHPSETSLGVYSAVSF